MDRHIEATTQLHATTASAREIMVHPAQVLGEGPASATPPTGTVHMTVPVTLGSGGSLEQTVAVAIGQVTGDGHGGAVIDLSWEPTGRERILPSFHGTLCIGESETSGSRLTISGAYRIPLGPVGRFGDTVLGRRVARDSLSEVVSRIARRIDSADVRRRQVSLPKPAHYNVDLREHTMPENYIG